MHLHTTDAAMAVAGAFFGPLGRRSDEVMAQFSGDELAAVLRFLTGMGEAFSEVEQAHRAAGRTS